MTEVITSTKSSYRLQAEENAEKATVFGGKRFLGKTPRGAEVWVSFEVDKELLDLKINFTHELDVLLQEGAILADKRVSVKRGSHNTPPADDLLRRSQKNQGGKVSANTLKHIQRLKNAVDSKHAKSYVKGKPSSLLFTYVAWAIFEGSYDMSRGDTIWSDIKDSFGFPKDGAYFTVESLPLFVGQLEQ